MLLMAALPAVELLGRAVGGFGIPNSPVIVQHLTLLVAFLGAMTAARFRRLLALATAEFLPGHIRHRVGIIVGAAGVAVSSALCAASVEFVRAEYFMGAELASWLPLWVILAIMPAGFAFLAVASVVGASEGVKGRLAAAGGLLIPLLFWLLPAIGQALAPALVVLLILGALLGLPIFAVMGGLALVLFAKSGVPAAAVPVEAYRLTASPMLPAIPLFTFAGYILAAGGASGRLVRVFTALFGWLPGGLAIVTVLVFAFFSSFTGASGITILSLGGLMLPVLVKARYPEKFSVGLVTSAGSIGLLFPPSLPVILYGVYSQTAIDKMFLGGLLPGLLLVSIVAAMGFRQGWLTGAGRSSFALAAAASSVWEAKWELVLPVIVLVGIFGGFATLVEAAALAALYALVAECFIYGELKLFRDVPRVSLECAALVGGVLLILGMALGLTNYLVDAEIPSRLLAWVQVHVDSRIVFLLILNVFLLGVGCLLDIYSAILVVVPLITPLGAAFGVDPVHLGIIFLANLELGYLTPPIGMNLFLAAYRFEKPLMQVYRWTLPFLLVRIVSVLVITYFPPLSLYLVRIFRP